jgi:hypothetical protein
VKTKSKPVLGFVLPNNNFETPTTIFRSNKESTERFIGRHDLNLLLIIIEVNSKKDAVIPLNPKSSTNITRVGVLPGVISKKSRSYIHSSTLLIQVFARTC